MPMLGRDVMLPDNGWDKPCQRMGATARHGRPLGWPGGYPSTTNRSTFHLVESGSRHLLFRRPVCDRAWWPHKQSFISVEAGRPASAEFCANCFNLHFA
jgi:hypothetical protein